MDEEISSVPEHEYVEQEYSDVEVSLLVQQALNSGPALNHSWLETRMYPWLYEALSTYMNKADLVYMLWSLRAKFLEGFTHTTPTNLHRVCERCRLCTNVTDKAVTPFWNTTDPDLMIVVENPTVAQRYGSFLGMALKKSGFKSDRCMLTFLTRCPLGTDDINSSNIANCSPYLHSEMNAANPKLILVMGSKCWGSVTGDLVHKISDIEMELTWMGLFPLLPAKSLGWYAYNSETRDDSKFVEVLNIAHDFLYASQKEKIEVPADLLENLDDAEE